MSLFRSIPNPEAEAQRPLADRMRPRTLDEFVGQEQILAPGKPLRTQIEPALIAGLELSGMHAVVRNSWRDQLEQVRMGLQGDDGRT